MDSLDAPNNLPDSESPNLHLAQATADECVKIWANTSASWRDSLTTSVYLQEQLFLTTVPLAKHNGMTTWILVEKNLPQDQRRILCSCESFIKHSLMSDSDGNIEKVIVHGVASVFCPLEYRGRGYAARHMTELAKILYTWQSDQARVAGSVLYSDIGKSFYAKFGWKPNATNWHVEFQSKNIPRSPLAQELIEDDLKELCRRDEVIIRGAMITSADKVKKLITILPDLDHMLWHIGKENFATEQLFGKRPRAKGVIAGPPGGQIWAIWTHRYYVHPNTEPSSNVLYILRLVVEGDDHENKPPFAGESESQTDEQRTRADSLIAVLQCAQAEAAEWKLDCVKLWEPSPWVQDVISKSNIHHFIIEREEDSIASGLWYDENGGYEAAPLWTNNEHYAWC